MKYCPFCGTKMRDEMNFCPICGKKYKQVELISQPSGPVSPAEPPVFAQSSTPPEVSLDRNALSSLDIPRKASSQQEPSEVFETLPSPKQDPTRTTPKAPPPLTTLPAKGIAFVILASALLLTLIFGVLRLLDSPSSSIPNAVLQARESVVRIIVDRSSGDTVSGSGFVVSNTTTSTYIATNAHVVAKMPVSIRIQLDDKEVSAEIFACETSRDLCILRCDRLNDIPPLQLSTAEVKPGDTAYALGFPDTADSLSAAFVYSSHEATITDGTIGAVRSTTLMDRGPTVSLLRINAAINSGNSGGPLLDRRGRVIGINTCDASDPQGIVGAVSAKELDEIMTHREVPWFPSSDMNWNAILIFTAVTLCLLSAWILLKKFIPSQKAGLSKEASAQMSDRSPR